MLPSLTFIAAQGADLHSTHRVLAAGGREANPLMDTTTPDRIIVKAVQTGAIVLLASKVGKRHPRAAKVLVYVAAGATFAAAAHNYRVATGARR